MGGTLVAASEAVRNIAPVVFLWLLVVRMLNWSGPMETTLIKYETTARAELARRLASRGAQAKLAEQLDVSQATVCKWVSGTNRPDPHLRIALEILYGISRDAWLTNDELAAIESARSVARTLAPTGTEG